MALLARFVFRHVYPVSTRYLSGSGGMSFQFSVNGNSVGDREMDFHIGPHNFIQLAGIWSAVIDVEHLRQVAVVMQARDADPHTNTDLGTITFNLSAPWLPREYVSHNSNFSVEWGIEMASGTDFVRFRQNDVFSCREHNGSVTCTTMNGITIEARLEIHPVIPTPVAIPPGITAAFADPVRPATVNTGGPPVLNDNLPPAVTGAGAINALPNPPVIPILANPNTSTAAVIEYTFYHPATLQFVDVADPRTDNTRDDRLTWTAVPVSGGTVDFLGPNGNKGLRVLVYGKTAGEVRMEVRLRGALIATYRALVAPFRQIPCRVNILNGPNAASQPAATPANVVDIVSIANRYLYQLGLELAFDQDTTRTNNATATTDSSRNVIHGVFRIRVDAGYTRNVVNGGAPGDVAAALNYRQGVMNFAYVHSSNANSFAAAAWNYPNHPSGANFSDNGTPSTSWVKPSGVAPDVAAVNNVMRLVPGFASPHPQLFAMLISGAYGDPVANAARYAQGMCHELGHLMGLGHRNPANPAEMAVYNDQIGFPPIENMMYFQSGSPRRNHYDIIQAKAAHASVLVANHSVILP
jgi:hypothetical protein